MTLTERIERESQKKLLAIDGGGIPGRRVRLEASRRLPTVDLGKVQIHQDQVGLLGDRTGDPFGAGRGTEDLAAALHVEEQSQHVEVVLIVFDIEKSGQDRTLVYLVFLFASASKAPTRLISSAGA